jgi:PAS domain S-box-containing protein
MTPKKPSYEELEHRIRELEKKVSPTAIEEALRESKELFEKTFRSQRDAIFILNAHIPPVIIDCNPAAEKIFGYSRHEMLGKDTEFLHISKDALAEFQKKFYPTIAKQGFFYLKDFMMKRKDGTFFPSEHTVVPLDNEKAEHTGWTSVVRDITSQKQMEEAMRKSNEDYRLLAENVSDVIFIRDMNLRFTYISPSVEKLTGYSVEEAMALTLAEAYTPHSVEVAMEAFSEELSLEKGGQSDPSRVRTIEMEGYRKDGSTIWTEAKLRFLRDSNGHPTGMLGVSRDITERRQAEMAVRISEERYRTVVEDMPALMCRFLPDGTLTFVNNSLCDYFAQTRENLIGQDFFQFISEEEREGVKRRFTSLTMESPVVTYELQIIAPDGTRRWQQRTDRALFDEAGNSKEYQCLGLDATDRKRVEEALFEKEAIFSAFLEHSPIYVFFKDKEIRSIHLSRNYEQLLGMPLGQVIGKTMDELFPSDLAKSMIAGDKRVLHEGRRLDVVEELGGRIYETIKFPVYKDGTPFVLAGFTMDITERKRAEEALRESEKRYKQLFNHAPAGIYELDFHKQRFIAVNDIMCQYTGYSEEEFLTMGPYDILSDDGKALYAQRCKKLVAGENVSEAVEYNVITKGGEDLWVALNISPVYENGKVKGVTAVVHNITERRKVEQKLRQSEERLRSLSLELMKAQENESTRISKELHDELGQSLAILKHRVRSTGKKLLAHQPQMSNDNDATVELVDAIIEKVRQISRDLNPSVLEDVGFCPALRSLAGNFAQEYQIPVTLDIEEIDALFSKETAKNLYRIFQEALTNIAKHADASHAKIQIRKSPEYVYFLIEDDGKGFDTNEARARDEKRKGLGLPLMEERADLVGGTLDIRSREGAEGTKILLTVPIEKRGVK